MAKLVRYFWREFFYLPVFTFTMPLLAVASLAVSQHTPRDAVATVEACQMVLHQCMLEGCAEADVIRACPIEGFSGRSLAILRTEADSAYNRLESHEERETCVQDFRAFWLSTLARLDLEDLQFGYPHDPNSTVLSLVTEETIIRAELDRAMSDELGRIVNEEHGWACPIPPWSPLAMLRGQNLAFVESRELLSDLAFTENAPGWALGSLYIYIHADLWHPEQARALKAFEELVHTGALHESRLTALRNRIAGHQQLYEDADLVGEWPSRSNQAE